MLKRPKDTRSPAWARWKARDSDGKWYWFENRPRWNKRRGEWVAIRGNTCAATLEQVCQS